MKKYIIFFFVVFIASQSFGQKQEKKDSVVVKTDSNTKDTVAHAAAATKSVKTGYPAGSVGDSLTKVNDSLSHLLSKYQVLYSAIKEKVIKHDFDPLRMSFIIDSLAARRDSSFSKITSSTSYLKDTISALKTEIARLKLMIGNSTPEEITRDKQISELKQLKVLFDSGILTRTEFDIMKAKVLAKML